MFTTSKRPTEEEDQSTKRSKAGNGISTNDEFVHAVFNQGKQLFSRFPKVRDDQAHEVLAKILREVNLKVIRNFLLRRRGSRVMTKGHIVSIICGPSVP